MNHELSKPCSPVARTYDRVGTLHPPPLPPLSTLPPPRELRERRSQVPPVSTILLRQLSPPHFYSLFTYIRTHTAVLRLC